MLSKFIEVIAPPSCIVCGHGDKLMCEDCSQSHLVRRTPACFACNKISHGGKTCPACRHKTNLSGVLVAFRFEDAAKELVYKLKYQSDKSVARFLAREMAAVVDASKFDLITYVPSDGATLRRRGYNQAQLLAGELAKLTDLAYGETLLRTKHSPQTKLTRRERFGAIKSNFVVLPTHIENKRLLVIDDVLTTGATLSECARILKEAGAKSVWGVVAAKK